MDAAQILKPFANEHIPADTKETATAEHTSVIITMKNVNKSYKMGSGSLHVLKDISLTVEQGEYLAILGPSGSGKSTLMNIIGCMDVLDEGTYNLDGVEIEKAKEKELTNIRNQKIGFVFQNFNLFPHFSVLKNVYHAPLKVQKRTDKDEVISEAYDLLTKVGLSDKSDAYPCELSGGQQQRVAIARALALHPKIMYFDEPTSSLDPEITAEVLRLLKQLASEKMTMVIVTHEIDFARAVSDRVIFMDGGLVVENGKPEDVIDNPKNERTKAFLKKLHV